MWKQRWLVAAAFMAVLGIVVRKGDGALVTAFNAALKVLKDNDTLDKLYQKWFVEFKPS